MRGSVAAFVLGSSSSDGRARPDVAELGDMDGDGAAELVAWRHDAALGRLHGDVLKREGRKVPWCS